MMSSNAPIQARFFMAGGVLAKSDKGCADVLCISMRCAKLKTASNFKGHL
jgi:hypothetical protein